MSVALGLPTPPPDMEFLHTTFSKDYQSDERAVAFEFAVLVFVYTSVLAVFFMMAALMLKLLGFCDDGGEGGGVVTERSGLLSKAAAPVVYGVFEEDEESGTCSRSNSSEDLFQGKVCVICYDKKRSWFFVPCGHCATCSSCTKRIVEGESKTCPFCRGFIQRVSRLLNPSNHE